MTTQNKDQNKSDQKSYSSDNKQSHGKQGFASMPTEQVKEIASKGGKASHKNENKEE